MTCCCTPVAIFVAFTMPFGTSALLASFTVPETLPPAPAHEAAAKNMTIEIERHKGSRHERRKLNGRQIKTQFCRVPAMPLFSLLRFMSAKTPHSLVHWLSIGAIATQSHLTTK